MDTLAKYLLFFLLFLRYFTSLGLLMYGYRYEANRYCATFYVALGAILLVDAIKDHVKK